MPRPSTSATPFGLPVTRLRRLSGSERACLDECWDRWVDAENQPSGETAAWVLTQFLNRALAEPQRSVWDVLARSAIARGARLPADSSLLKTELARPHEASRWRLLRQAGARLDAVPWGVQQEWFAGCVDDWLARRSAVPCLNDWLKGGLPLHDARWRAVAAGAFLNRTTDFLETLKSGPGATNYPQEMLTKGFRVGQAELFLEALVAEGGPLDWSQTDDEGGHAVDALDRFCTAVGDWLLLPDRGVFRMKNTIPAFRLEVALRATFPEGVPSAPRPRL